MSSHTTALLKFWIQPAASTRTLLAADAGHGPAVIMAACFGSVQSARLYVVAEQPSLMTFLYGALCGILGLFLFGLFFRVSGRLFKVEPKPKAVRTSLGLGLLPWTLAFLALIYMVQSSEDAAALAKLYPLFFVFFLYGYTLLILSLSVSLGLGLWKTFVCIAVTFIGSLFPLTLIAQLIFGTPAA